MKTAKYTNDNPFAVSGWKAKAKSKTEKTSYILCHSPARIIRPASLDCKTAPAQAIAGWSFQNGTFSEVSYYYICLFQKEIF
jgi:hypothetical protein